MGTYLVTGITNTIQISKRHKATVEYLESLLSLHVNLKKFMYLEGKEAHHWEIKDDALEDNLVPFLREQLRMYGSSSHKYDFLKKITGLTGKKIKNFAINANKGGPDYFQLITNIIETEGEWPSFIEVHYGLISFFMDGKIIMECYNNIFHYFEELIRLQQDKYPIADCVRVMITA